VNRNAEKWKKFLLLREIRRMFADR